MYYLNKIRLCACLALFFLISYAVCLPQGLTEETWREEKGEHFIIMYPLKVERPWARKVLNEAERDYDRIADKIGYTRYKDFWTWEDRVQILIYADHQAFVEKTGRPQWAEGFTPRDLNLFENRVIVTYKQETGFLNGVLPHEITHLILRDFVGSDKQIPVWFDEGVAQLQEDKKQFQADLAMRLLVRQKQYFSVNKLFQFDVQQADAQKVGLFYLQSVSIVDFLIKRYGSSRFGDFCKNLRDGYEFEEALRKAYTNMIDSISQLEDKWVDYLMNG